MLLRLLRERAFSGPLSSSFARLLELPGDRAQVVEQNEQIANERLLERIAHEIIAVADQFLMKRIEQFLVNGFALPDRRELLLDFLEMQSTRISERPIPPRLRPAGRANGSR